MLLKATIVSFLAAQARYQGHELPKFTVTASGILATLASSRPLLPPSLVPKMFFKFRRKWRPRPLSQGCAVFLSLLLFRQVAASSPKASKLSPTGAGGLGEVPGASQPGSRCPRSCGNGFCDEERAECVCYPGWRGDECHLCGGKIR